MKLGDSFTYSISILTLEKIFFSCSGKGETYCMGW